MLPTAQDTTGPGAYHKLLEQLEMQIEALKADTTQADARLPKSSDAMDLVRTDMITNSTAYLSCHGNLLELDETTNETLEVISRPGEAIA